MCDTVKLVFCFQNYLFLKRWVFSLSTLVMLQAFLKHLVIHSGPFIFNNKGIRLTRSSVYVGGI